jgi:hypothetical protein
MMTITQRRARTMLIFLPVICIAIGLFIGYELGKATPCTDVESFDIRPLQ